MEFEKVTGMIDLEELTEESTIMDEAVGGSGFVDLIVGTYTAGMSMFIHFCVAEIQE